MADEKRAATEGILERMWKGEWHDLDLLLSRTGDVQFWTDILRFELDLETLARGLLRSDRTLTSLKEFEVSSMSAFHYAGMRGASNVLRRGLQVGLNVEVGLRNGTTVLHLASFAGKMETVELLVDELQAYVNREDGQRRCPLHYASAQGHQQVVEFLVSRGADIGARDADGTTAAYHARKHRQEPIVSYLLDISGDGDILLAEVQSSIREIETASAKAIPLYTSVNRDTKKTRLPVSDYEELEQSYDRDVRVDTVKANQDADEKTRPMPADKKKKHDKRIVYENTEYPIDSLREAEGDNTGVSKTRHIYNGAKHAFDKMRHILKTSAGPASGSFTIPKVSNECSTSDRSDESNAVGKYGLESSRKQDLYDEIKPPDDASTDSYGYASVEETANMTKSGFVRRNHVYEEIALPDDPIPYSEIGLHKRTTLPCTEDGMLNMNAKINKFSNSTDPKIKSKILNESCTEQEIIPTIDISKFVRRQHQYEEIRLSYDEDAKQLPFNKDQVEQEVRQLLRTEMRKLVRLRNADDADNSMHASDKDIYDQAAISSVVDVTENAEESTNYSHRGEPAVITLRELRRIVRDEFQRFAEQRGLKEPLSKLGVQSKELEQGIVSTSSLMPSAAGLYEEISISGLDGCYESELGQFEIIKTEPRKEKDDIFRKEMKTRDDSPSILPKSTDQRKPEIAEKPHDESKLHFSPLLLRRDPHKRKEKGTETRSPNRSPEISPLLLRRDPHKRKETGTETRSPNRSPLRLNVQSDTRREANGPLTEQDLQKSNEPSAKPGQSQFYVNLAHSNKFSDS